MIIDLANPETDVKVWFKQFRKWMKRDYSGKHFDTISIVDWLSEKYKKFPVGNEAILLAAAWKECGLIEFDQPSESELSRRSLVPRAAPDSPFAIWRIKDDKPSQSPKRSEEARNKGI